MALMAGYIFWDDTTLVLPDMIPILAATTLESSQQQQQQQQKLQEKYKADMAYWHGTVIFEYLCCVYIGEGGDYTRRIEVKMMRSAE